MNEVGSRYRPIKAARQPDIGDLEARLARQVPRGGGDLLAGELSAAGVA